METGLFVVRFFEQLEQITTHYQLAYDDGSLLLIDLSQCQFDG